MKWRGAIIALGCLAAVGCAHLATRAEKEASFQPFARQRLNGEELRDYIEDRSAIVVAGATPGSVKIREGEVGVGLHPTGADGKVDVSSAAAISRDGYFLTAAHCIRRQPVFLVITTAAGPRACAARVVWQPPSSQSMAGLGEEADFDLAVLKVPAMLTGSFSLAMDSDLVVGNFVVTSGANGEAGGKLLSVTRNDPIASLGVPYSMTLVHDVPLTHGDSGGPLASLNGKLIGIEVLVRGVYIGPRQGVALRPDPQWVRRILDEDRAKN